MLTRFINYKLLILSNLFIACLFYSVITGCDKLVVAADRQRHEDQEYSSPPVHCKCNDPGTFIFVSVLILAIIQDQALVASKRSKHYLVGKKSPGHKKVGGSIKIDLILQIQGPHLGSKREESSSHWVPPSNSWTNATSPGWVICIIRF